MLLAPRKQQQEDFFELETNVVYIVGPGLEVGNDFLWDSPN